MNPRFLLLFALLAAGAAAQTLVVEPRPTPDKRAMPQALQLRSLAYSVAVTDGVAVTTVEHVFYNPGPRWEEGSFLYPLPEGAHLQQFSMWIGGRETMGEVLTADKARAVYTDIVRRMVDPALLEYMGSGLLKARVFPIEARSEKRVRLRYVHLPAGEGRLSRFSWPLRACRLGGPTVADFRFEATVTGKADLQTVYSPTFDMEIVRKGAHAAHVGFEAHNLVPDRNLELLVSAGTDGVGMDLLTHADGSDRTFWMTLMPAVTEEQPVPRDLIFALDTSGSMAGDKLAQARRALHYCIDALNPKDRFALIRFGTEASSAADTWLDADRAGREHAHGFVDDLQAVGGTNMGEALELAARLPADPNRPRVLILLSDGKPTIGVRAQAELTALAKRLGAVRIFPFGIGLEINTLLLDTLAADSGGLRTYVTPDEDLELKLSTFFSRIQAPVLTDPHLRVEGVTLLETHPKTLPDLYKGTPLHLFGRYRGDGPARVTLEGTVAGRRKSFVYTARFAASNPGNAFIPGLWAQRRVGYLLDQIRLGADDREVVDEVVRLAKQFGIVTPYTSYLIVEDGAGEGVVQSLFEDTAGGRGERDDARRRMAESRKETGVEAVKASRDFQDMAQAEAPAMQPAPRVHEQAAAPRTQIVAGRGFYQQGAQWLDSRLEVVRTDQRRRLTYAGDAYFQLLADHPDLAPILALGTQVRFFYNGTIYDIVPP